MKPSAVWISPRFNSPTIFVYELKENLPAPMSTELSSAKQYACLTRPLPGGRV